MSFRGFDSRIDLHDLAWQSMFDNVEQRERERENERREREREKEREQAALRARQAAEQRMEEERRRRRRTPHPVVVVGCGASGIACLKKLGEAGVPAIGLEASDRIGGRINTVEFGESVVDLGAAWCHGETNNLVYELASPHDLLGRPAEPEDRNAERDWFIFSDGSLMPYGNAQNVLDALNSAVEHCNKNNSRSILDFVQSGVQDRTIGTQPAVVPITDPFLEWYDRDQHLGGQTGLPDHDPRFRKSLKGLQEHKKCEGEFWLNWKGQGYKTVLDLLMGTHPSLPSTGAQSFNIQYNKEVTGIMWQTDDPDEPKPTVLVTCSDGTVTKASRVVVTVSLGVLKEKYRTMFTPPLPQKNVTAIQNLQFCVLDKIYIQFRSAWWPNDLTNFNIIWKEEDKEKFAENEKWVTGIHGLRTVEYQPNVLLAWLYGSNAEAMERVDSEGIERGVEKLLDIFRDIFIVTRVTAIKRSTWASNPLIRGAYSYRAMSTEDSNTGAADLKTPLVHNGMEVVLFGGEAASERYHNAVHGALDAGYAAADKAIAAAAADRARNQ